jgi:hypothetical protein
VIGLTGEDLRVTGPAVDPIDVQVRAGVYGTATSS